MKKDNRQGTLNEQLTYWKGQKRHINDNNNEGSFNYKLNGNTKTAPPKHTNDRNNQKSATSIEKDNRNQILAPPKQLVKQTMAYEISVLNYHASPLPKEKKQRACSLYFRGSNSRRLIGAYLILQTLSNLGTTQKQMKDKFTHMSKGFISNVFKESIIAEWFYKEQSLVSQNLFIYYAAPIMVNGAYDYYRTIKSSRDELLFTK